MEPLLGRRGPIDFLCRLWQARCWSVNLIYFSLFSSPRRSPMGSQPTVCKATLSGNGCLMLTSRGFLFFTVSPTDLALDSRSRRNFCRCLLPFQMSPESLHVSLHSPATPGSGYSLWKSHVLPTTSSAWTVLGRRRHSVEVGSTMWGRDE